MPYKLICSGEEYNDGRRQHFSALKVKEIVSSIVLVQVVPDFSPDIKIGERSCTPEIKKT